MSKKTALLKNTLIIALGKISTQMVTFLLLPVYTAFLSPEEYGAVDLIISYILLLAPMATLQLEMAAFRFLVDARGNASERKQIISNTLQIVLAITAACAIIFWVTTQFINLKYSGLILLYICATIFSNMFLQFARGMGDNKKFAFASITTAISTLMLSIIFVVFIKMGAGGVLLSVGLANLVCTVYLFINLKLYKLVDFSAKNITLKKELLRYSLPLVPNGISWWVINVSDRTIISLIIGVAANGIYAVANKFAMIFSGIFAVFYLSWSESASMHINAKDRDDFFSETINASLRMFAAIGLMLIAWIPPFFNVVVGKDFSEAYLYVPILMIGAFFNAIVGFYSAIYIAKKLTKQVANTSVVAAIINIVLNLIFVNVLGIWAAALSTAVAFFAMAVYRHYDVKKYVKITYQKGIFVKIIALYAFTIVLYYYNNTIGNVANLLITTVVCIWLNKSVISTLKNKVFSKLKKLTPEQQIAEEESLAIKKR